MEAVNGMGCPERSTSTLGSNQDLAYAITREGAKVGVEDHIVVKDSITETEHTKIRLVRALVETRDPSSKVREGGEFQICDAKKNNEGSFGGFPGYICSHRIQGMGIKLKRPRKISLLAPIVPGEDDLMIRRFLRARDLDVEKASAMFLKYLKWRRSFVPNGSISLSEVPNELAQDKVFTQGRDKIGRPILIVFGRKHFQNKDGPDEFRRFVVYVLDKLCASIPPGQEKFVGIAEIKGWGYSNSDVRGYISAMSILQDYYPERLGKLFIVHAPFIFMSMWKIVSPFIDNKTKKKIVFVEDSKLESTLLEEIDESQLPEIYGGQLQLVPIQHSYLN